MEQEGGRFSLFSPPETIKPLSILKSGQNCLYLRDVGVAVVFSGENKGGRQLQSRRQNGLYIMLKR